MEDVLYSKFVLLMQSLQQLIVFTIKNNYLVLHNLPLKATPLEGQTQLNVYLEGSIAEEHQQGLISLHPL